MTDAQIALYADLRVAVPVEWRIAMIDFDRTQFVYLTRPVYAEPAPVPVGGFLPGYEPSPYRQVVGIEKLCVAAPLWMVNESAQARRHVVIEALDQIRHYEYEYCDQ